MGLLDFLLGGRKALKKVSTRQKGVQKKRKTARKPRSVSMKMIEDPIMTVSRQLTLIQNSLNRTNELLSSGFQGLRDDHHRILESQLSATDFENFKVWLEDQITILDGVKQKIGRKIAILEIDKRILDLLEGKGHQRSAEIAQCLSITRQYAATRLNALQEVGFVKSVKKGRKIFYNIKKRPT